MTRDDYRMKGIDANADEPPEFSDDEEERLYYEKLKAKQATNSKESDVPFKRKRASSKFLAQYQSLMLDLYNVRGFRSHCWLAIKPSVE